MSSLPATVTLTGHRVHVSRKTYNNEVLNHELPDKIKRENLKITLKKYHNGKDKLSEKLCIWCGNCQKRVQYLGK